MEPVEFRISAALRQQVAEQAERRGISFSEYCRQALIFALGWTAAIDSVAAGGRPEHLTTIELLAQRLADVTDDDAPPETHPHGSPAPPKAAVP